MGNSDLGPAAEMSNFGALSSVIEEGMQVTARLCVNPTIFEPL
jgi:hypothetical protein